MKLKILESFEKSKYQLVDAETDEIINVFVTEESAEKHARQYIKNYATEEDPVAVDCYEIEDEDYVYDKYGYPYYVDEPKYLWTLDSRNGYFGESKNRSNMKLRVDEKISEKDYSNSVTGKAYKVFRVKNGKLYPPMVANAGGADTPVGVWLDAEEGEFAGLSKTGRKQVKSTGSGSLAYRPGWHLGDIPRAKQFDRSFSWKVVDDDPSEAVKSVKTMQTFINSCAKASNVGNIYYVDELGKCVQVVDDNAPYFPYDFVWAECDYVMDIDYQEESDEQGYMRTRADGTTYRSDKYQHSLAGLPKLPVNGYYKYRTNPNPDTVPWVITGAMKVTKLLDDNAVAEILGGNAPERQGGNKTLKELGL